MGICEAETSKGGNGRATIRGGAGRSFCEAVSQVSFQIELGGILVFSINTSIFDILSL